MHAVGQQQATWTPPGRIWRDILLEVKKEANRCISPVPPFSPCFHPLDPYVSNATHGALPLHCKSFALMYVMSYNAMCTYIFHVGKPQACHLLLPSFSLFSLLLANILPQLRNVPTTIAFYCIVNHLPMMYILSPNATCTITSPPL